jgi:hypothetical protein
MASKVTLTIWQGGWMASPTVEFLTQAPRHNTWDIKNKKGERKTSEILQFILYTVGW